LVDDRVLCSPRCERGRFVTSYGGTVVKYETNHRHSDKTVIKIGLAGLKKKQ
jgi:hypothetical protein